MVIIILSTANIYEYNNNISSHNLRLSVHFYPHGASYSRLVKRQHVTNLHFGRKQWAMWKMPTRKENHRPQWSVRAASVSSVLGNYDRVLAAPNAMTVVAKPVDCCDHWSDSRHFSLRVALLVFELVDDCNTSLQSKSLTIAAAKSVATTAVSALKNMRCESKFTSIFWWSHERSIRTRYRGTTASTNATCESLHWLQLWSCGVYFSWPVLLQTLLWSNVTVECWGIRKRQHSRWRHWSSAASLVDEGRGWSEATADSVHCVVCQHGRRLWNDHSLPALHWLKSDLWSTTMSAESLNSVRGEIISVTSNFEFGVERSPKLEFSIFGRCIQPYRLNNKTQKHIFGRV